MEEVEKFFHHISPLLIKQTLLGFSEKHDIKYKEVDTPNIATEVDLNNELLIKNELSKYFPNDGIIAEETENDISDVSSGRKWIIDPICGSLNLNNGIKFFCTNIALAENGKLIASCVIDYSKENYIWSIGDNLIYIGNTLIKPDKKSKGYMVDIDLSSTNGKSEEVINLYASFVRNIINDKSMYTTSFACSLPFTYTALGIIDAYVNNYSSVWDLAAANFLIEQAGGIITGLDGKKWNLTTDGCIGARDKELHTKLLNFLL